MSTLASPTTGFRTVASGAAPPKNPMTAISHSQKRSSAVLCEENATGDSHNLDLKTRSPRLTHPAALRDVPLYLLPTFHPNPAVRKNLISALRDLGLYEALQQRLAKHQRRQILSPSFGEGTGAKKD